MTERQERGRQILEAGERLELALRAPGLTRAQRDDLGREFWFTAIVDPTGAMAAFVEWCRLDRASERRWRRNER